MASVWGAALGVSFFFVIKEVLRARMHQLLRGAGGEHELIAYGIILILVMIFVPEGLTFGGIRALGRVRDIVSLRRGERQGREPQTGQAG
jgi:branched-chain amino acid transport system permease protein